MRDSKLFDLGALGNNGINTLLVLLRSLPQATQQLLASNQDLGPVLGGLAGNAAKKAIDWTYDALSGTRDSDLRLSQRIGSTYVQAMRLRDRNIATRRFKNEYRINRALAAASAADSTQAVNTAIREIYGADAKVEDSFGAGLIRSIYRENAEKAYEAGVVGFRDALATGANVNAKFRTADNIQLLGREVMRASLGYVDEQGIRHASITKSLSTDEVRSAVAEFTKLGGFSGGSAENNLKEMKDYLRKIAGGVDNIRQVMGDNVSLDQAKAMISGLTGTSAAATNADVFERMSARFRDMSYATGIGDKEWRMGTAAARQALDPFGIPQAISAGVGVNIAGAWAMGRNKHIGVSDRDWQQVAVGIAAKPHIDGSAQRAATALSMLELDGVTVTDEVRNTIYTTALRGEDAVKDEIAKLTKRDRRAVDAWYMNRYGDESVLRKATDPALTQELVARQSRAELSRYNNTLNARAESIFGIEGAKHLRSVLGDVDFTSLTTAEINERVEAYNRANPNSRIDMVKLSELTRAHQNLEQSTSGGLGTFHHLTNAVQGTAQRRAPQVGRYGLDPSLAIIKYLNDDLSAVAKYEGDSAYRSTYAKTYQQAYTDAGKLQDDAKKAYDDAFKAATGSDLDKRRAGAEAAAKIAAESAKKAAMDKASKHSLSGMFSVALTGEVGLFENQAAIDWMAEQYNAVTKASSADDARKNAEAAAKKRGKSDEEAKQAGENAKKRYDKYVKDNKSDDKKSSAELATEIAKDELAKSSELRSEVNKVTKDAEKSDTSQHTSEKLDTAADKLLEAATALSKTSTGKDVAELRISEEDAKRMGTAFAAALAGKLGTLMKTWG